jgi:hypothetical protein
MTGCAPTSACCHDSRMPGRVALVAVIAVAPLAICIIVALMRGYTIDLHMSREERRGRD